MELDAAPEEPAPPLGPGPKLGTVVTMVEFHEATATGQQPYYQDHHMRAEAQRRKSEATERRILETFYGVPASTWEAAASLPLVNSSPEQRMGYQQVSEWKKTLRVGDKVDVTFRGFWHEAVIRTVPDLTNMSGHSLTYARPAAVSAFVNKTGVCVLLLTLDHAQSAGLTLTVASTVVLLDPVLDTSIEDQAIARVHRIGQSVPVTAIRLCQGDTIDETIVALQSARRGGKRQKGALSATGQVRIQELAKLFSVKEEQV